RKILRLIFKWWKDSGAKPTGQQALEISGMIIPAWLSGGLSSSLRVYGVEFFNAELSALRQEILINFGDLVISFLGSLVDIVLRTGIGSFIFGLDALIFIVHGGPISINDESCKKRPLEGVT